MVLNLETVVIAPTTRNEGHGKFILEVDEGGVVKKGSFLSMVTVRGFEKFLVGREMEFAPVATSRFCGLCPPTHATASSEAIERSIGVTPPHHGLLLRELCNIGNHLHDHPLQQVLILPDFVKDPGKAREALVRIQRMRRIGQYICSVAGGEAIHSPYIRIGGMYTNISEAARNRLIELLTGYRQYHEEQKGFMEEAFDSSDVPEGLGAVDVDVMATDLIYGSSEVYANEYHPHYSEELPANYYGKDVGVEACTVIPMLRGRIVEVGPRARLWKFRGYKEKGTMALNRARLEEITVRVERGLEILRQLNTRANTLNRPVSYGDGDMGIGVNEAPRGTNVHLASVKDGRITYYKAMPATMWNIPVIGKATEGFHYRWAEWVMRAYDPCISCATHLLVINEGKVVEDRWVRPEVPYGQA
ncbi:coenzyme F420 hydrogenase, subunit alpha [Methanocella conradii HZ254]|uniref:Coenzyme F420 hydrogenase subunit alpha n=1 Tax=Methanocella conradii (strain DSM 24694 / JCM 17849 / CGMCC 1.5162 / HZ254) TaxID=1041930 RepID=H8I5T9_METCZ|nr:coenzyme F420 hydrogenase subunit alpha [Methanocella conradii]AFC99756.1 coenzyme F420 hydrogenase, subunit alpha [Methanocella conradii HZ254]